MKLLIYGVLLLFTLSGVQKCDEGGGDVDGTKVKLGETFEIELNQTGVFVKEEMGITFVSNKESRCPEGVTCIVAGEAIGSFKLRSDDSSNDLTLTAKGLCQKEDGSCGESKAMMGYTVKLISINPYPESADAKANKPLKAKLMVTKN